jgi:hypothetical protein
MILNSKVQGISYLVFKKDHRPYLSTSPTALGYYWLQLKQVFISLPLKD